MSTEAPLKFKYHHMRSKTVLNYIGFRLKEYTREIQNLR